MTIRLPELHAGQEASYDLKARFKAIRCGRRFGKTVLASVVVCEGVIRGESWGYFTPAYKFSSEVFREIHAMLEPVITSSSKVEGMIRVLGGGSVEFWTLGDPRAGRSRRYHGVVLDEVAFAEGDMASIFDKAIRPTLLDYRGVAWALSTPAGKNDDNWFYSICTDPALGWVEYHAPTSSNPTLPADEVERLQHENAPDVYRQEYLAEFVDWSGSAFFPIESLLVDGKPVPKPQKCDAIFACIDSAIKSQVQHDATACVWCAYTRFVGGARIEILDWQGLQVDGIAQSAWLETVFLRGEELARQCGAREGWKGTWIEDRASGFVMLQQAENLRKQGRYAPAYPIESKLTQMGKPERALAASPYVFRGHVKFSDEAFNKTSVLKGRSRNHLVSEISSFRLGAKDNAADDLLDAWMYCVLIACGSGSGPRKGV